MGPEVLAAVAIAGTLASAGATVMQGQAAASAAAYNAQVEEQNAQSARAVAQADANDIRLLGERDQSKLRAKVGALGLIPDEGSPYELLLDNAATIELDAQRRLYKGEVEARSHQSQAALDRQKTDMTGTYLAAGGQLLSGGAKAYPLLNGPSTPTKSGGGAAAP